MAAIAGQGVPSAIDAFGSGPGQSAAGGRDAQRAQLESWLGELREAADQYKQVLAKMPSLAPMGSKLDQLTQAILQQAMKTAPSQPDAAQQIPGGG